MITWAEGSGRAEIAEGDVRPTSGRLPGPTLLLGARLAARCSVVCFPVEPAHLPCAHYLSRLPVSRLHMAHPPQDNSPGSADSVAARAAGRLGGARQRTYTMGLWRSCEEGCGRRVRKVGREISELSGGKPYTRSVVTEELARPAPARVATPRPMISGRRVRGRRRERATYTCFPGHSKHVPPGPT